MRRAPTPLFVLVLASAACASRGSGAASPRETLTALQQAVQHNDVATLYAMLPAQSRREETFDQFRARMTADRPELGDMAHALGAALGEHRAPSVQLRLRDGSTASVVDDEDGWRVAQPGFGQEPAGTPEDAARAFRDALRRRSMSAVMDTLSARARGTFEAEFQSIVDALADPSSLAITYTVPPHERAEIHLRDGRTLVLVREGGNWRVEDVQ